MLHISKNKKRHSGSATLIRFCASDSFLTLVLYKFIYLLTYLLTNIFTTRGKSPWSKQKRYYTEETGNKTVIIQINTIVFLRQLLILI